MSNDEMIQDLVNKGAFQAILYNNGEFNLWTVKQTYVGKNLGQILKLAVEEIENIN